MQMIDAGPLLELVDKRGKDVVPLPGLDDKVIARSEKRIAYDPRLSASDCKQLLIIRKRKTVSPVFAEKTIIKLGQHPWHIYGDDYYDWKL